MSEGYLRRYQMALLLGSVTALAACGTTLRPIDDKKTARLLSPHDVLSIRDTCSESLKYADQTRRILVYRLDFEHERAVCARYGPYAYELVVILGPDDEVERYRLLRVK